MRKTVINLDNEEWSLKAADDQKWMPAHVPGCVHTDLLANKLIPDPFYRDNERSLQWIDKKDWIYKCRFSIDPAIRKYKNIRLVFLGLDTYAQVKINDVDILRADNMFRSWEVDVKHLLNSTENILTIKFISPITTGLEKLEKLGYNLPAVNDQSENGEMGDKKVSVFSRKAPYHFGWDWGPRFVTSGIWRSVQLECSDMAEIRNVHYEQRSVSPSLAQICARIEIFCHEKGTYEIGLSDGDNHEISSVQRSLSYGWNKIDIPFQVNDPVLWWPNGMGGQQLYTYRIMLSINGNLLDTASSSIGIRSLKLEREPDAAGKSFYFEINGKPVFAKGANYIPNDNFLDRVSSEKYEAVIQSAADANMNMLRVWGGGIYENDIFYELCDKKGILVWQDFMFACSMYPGDNEFLENVRNEAIENVKRLRNHPSIALWCGNNEMDMAWAHGDNDAGWGWKEKYTAEQQQQIWDSYDRLFHHILPEIVHEYDPLRYYWPSSPLTDIGVHADNKKSTSGDVHYWGVWHGMDPISAFHENVGRFMSEYGFQSFPDKLSIRRFTESADRDISSPVMLSHQRSSLGNQRILDYMKEYYPVPPEFDDIIYLGQLLQAESIKEAINAHRAKKNFCMGTLYWQLNDCWPAASWSGIDYYGRWKTLHYFVKKAFELVTVSFEKKNNDLLLYINNDSGSFLNVSVDYAVRDFYGRVLETNSSAVVASNLSATPAINILIGPLKKKYSFREIFLDIRLYAGNREIFSDQYYFVPPKLLKLPPAKIQYDPFMKNNDLIFRFSSDVLAKNVMISFSNDDLRLSDNYFDLLPGESKTIRCYNESNTKRALDLEITTLNDVLGKYEQRL